MNTITRSVLSLAVVVPAILCLILLDGSAPAAQAAGGDAAETEDLAKRVAALEKVVLADPYKPNDTVLARLDAIDEQLKAISKAGQAEAKGDDRSFDELRKAIEQQQRQNEAVEKRLRALEEHRKEVGANRGDDELRDLGRELEQLRKATADLVERVKKLEAQR